MDFILPIPSYWELFLAIIGMFMAIVSFVFAAGAFQPGFLAQEDAHTNGSFRLPGVATLVLATACLFSTVCFIWLYIPWYVAVPVMGLNLLYAPPMEEVFHKTFKSPGLIALVMSLLDMLVIYLMWYVP
ncbi:hypothetical protein AB8880_00620 [Alphaproteobacteria bacterium LSUCC0684]